MRTNTDISGKLTTFSGTLTLGNGTQLALTDSDLVSQSLSIKNAVGNSGELTVGGVVIGALSFGLMNDNDRFTNIDWYDSKITGSLTVESTTLDIGEFLVVSHKESGRTVSIEAYDRLKLCDEYGIHEDNITYPTTAGAIVGAICSARGMTYTGLRYPNMQIPDPEDDTMTEREVLSYIAQMMGQFAIVKNNVLTFGWYSSTPYNAGTTFGHDFQTSDKVIGGVEVKVSDDVKVTLGSGELVKIENNPFINEDNINTVASQINSVVSGMQYRVGSCAIVSSPAYECGDVFNVFTGRETVKVLVSNITYKKNYVQESIESYGTEVNDLRLSKTDRIKKLADKAISDQLKNPNSPLSKAIDDAGGGGDSEWGGRDNAYGTATLYANRSGATPSARTNPKWVLNNLGFRIPEWSKTEYGLYGPQWDIQYNDGEIGIFDACAYKQTTGSTSDRGVHSKTRFGKGIVQVEQFKGTNDTDWTNTVKIGHSANRSDTQTDYGTVKSENHIYGKTTLHDVVSLPQDFTYDNRDMHGIRLPGSGGCLLYDSLMYRLIFAACDENGNAQPFSDSLGNKFIWTVNFTSEQVN